MPKISQIDEVPCQAEVQILQKITFNCLHVYVAKPWSLSGKFPGLEGKLYTIWFSTLHFFHRLAAYSKGHLYSLRKKRYITNPNAYFNICSQESWFVSCMRPEDSKAIESFLLFLMYFFAFLHSFYCHVNCRTSVCAMSY